MFFIIPTGVNYRAERLPVVTFSIMGVNVLLYFVSLAMFWFGDAAPGGRRGGVEHRDNSGVKRSVRRPAR